VSLKNRPVLASYCITRLARGVLQSKPVDQIVQEITQAVSTGHYELRLTAQDTACYGYDLDTNLAKLSEKITTINSSHDFRVRVGMMNPNSVKPILHELIKAYEHPRIFKFLHLPVQSGDDELLSAMGRGYCVKEFIEILDIFRSAMPELTLSTDFIIGYPNETTEQFEHSLALLEQIRPNIVNITRFSARPGTSAAKLKNRLSGSKIKSRSREMTARRFAISNELNESQIGQRYRVLITERVKAGSVLARNDSYLPVVIKHNLPLGSWVNVEIKDATDSYLVGESNII
jgi:threonylcarbamoyladenosine tRNA methylthiotransferase CDKAL1